MTDNTLSGATECRRFVDDVLDGDARTCERARTKLWTYVWKVVQRLSLPIGPLKDDPDEKADIALRVMKKLEAERYKHLRDWRERQIAGVAHASFGRLIEVVATRAAIDHARAHPLQIAPRGQPFIWVTEEAKDPLVLAETVERQLAFMDSASIPQLTEHLELLAAVSSSGSTTAPAALGSPIAEPRRRVSRHVVRRR